MTIASTKNDGLTMNSVMLRLNSIPDPGVDAEDMAQCCRRSVADKLSGFRDSAIKQRQTDFSEIGHSGTEFWIFSWASWLT